ncbi:MAG TPA: hypothetical protein VN688_18845 [Gemmataceae bacterium]|nr:hypothetical protein [Gemmataceae bacterium]
MRTWTRLALAVLLALPFTLAPLHAADPELTAQQVEKLRKDLDTLRKDMEALKNEMIANSARGARAAEDLREIKDLLQRIISRQEQITRQSGYGPGPLPENGAAPASTGTITLRNRYSTAATVHINGRPYVIEPNRTATIAGVPLGTFNYDVDVDGYGLVQPLRSETLRPNGHEITIFPRIGG